MNLKEKEDNKSTYVLFQDSLGFKNKSYNKNYKFLKFFGLINKLFNKLEVATSKSKKAKIEIENQANEVLLEDSLVVYLKLLENGYKPPKIQFDLFAQKVGDLFSKNSTDIYKFYENGFTFSEEVFYTLLLNSSFQIYFNSHLLSMKLKNKTAKEEMKHYGEGAVLLLQQSYDFLNNEKHKVFIEHWIESLDDKSYFNKEYRVDNVYLLVKNIIVPILKSDEKKYLVKELKKHKLTKGLDFNGIVLEADYKDLINKTKAIYIEDKLTNLLMKKQKEITENIKVTELPDQAKKHLNKIEKIYNGLLQKIDSITETEINIVIEKRVPEILQKYLSIDMEYRKELKNVSGKSAEDLLIDSLKNILDFMEEKNKAINELKVMDLSVSERYTQKLSK